MAAEVILGIETSCDDSAAAVMVDGRLASSVLSSQTEVHSRYGGVVPEIAARRHEEILLPVIEEAMVMGGVRYPDLGAIGVTHGPGLIGSLLVGVATARALGLVANCPVVGINHLEAHVLSSFLDVDDLRPPTLCLLVSGGHTLLVHVRGVGDYVVLGETRDDAVGEVYDKVARYLGLGYPGGPVVDDLAKHGDPTRLPLPRPMMSSGFELSFSGLKTATIRAVNADPTLAVEDICASFVAAVVDVLVDKVRNAARQLAVDSVCIGGGVAASGPLRDGLVAMAEVEGLRCYLPPRAMCTDNAAMVAHATKLHIDAGTAATDFETNPSLSLNGPT